MPALPFEMTVELGKVREFADAVRADGPGLDFTDPDPISFTVADPLYQKVEDSELSTRGMAHFAAMADAVSRT
jgi:hypothetical protein